MCQRTKVEGQVPEGQFEQSHRISFLPLSVPDIDFLFFQSIFKLVLT